MSAKNKKWKLALWGYVLGTVISIGGLVLVCCEQAGGLAVIIQGLGIITLIFGGYSTANLMQKNVVSKNYIPALDENNTEGK